MSRRSRMPRRSLTGSNPRSFPPWSRSTETSQRTSDDTYDQGISAIHAHFGDSWHSTSVAQATLVSPSPSEFTHSIRFAARPTAFRINAFKIHAPQPLLVHDENVMAIAAYGHGTL